MKFWKALAFVMISLLAVAAGLRFFLTDTHSFGPNEPQKIFGAHLKVV